MSGGKPPKIKTPKDPAPIPTPVSVPTSTQVGSQASPKAILVGSGVTSGAGTQDREVKKKAGRKARRGREANILAGRMTSQRYNILNTTLG